MLYHLEIHLSTLGARAESEESEFEESESEEMTRVSLGHSQRDLVAQESTFCRNKKKGRNYKSIQQHIFISFSFSGKKNGCPPSLMLDVIFV